MLIGFIISILLYYLFCSIGYYLVAVLISWDKLRFWNFDVKDGYIGICPYPKYLLFWLEWIIINIKKVNR